MMRIRHKNEILISVATALLVVALSNTAPMQSLDRMTYDWGIQLSDRDVSDKIVVVAIDENSIESLGRWPWSRDIHAALIDVLSESQAKVIAYTVFFLEPQLDKGVGIVDGLLANIEESRLFDFASKVSDEHLKQKIETGLNGLIEALFETRAGLDSDTALSASLKNAGNVVLPMFFKLDKPLGNLDQPLPPVLQKQRLHTMVPPPISDAANGKTALTAIEAYFPIESFSNSAAGIGHLTLKQDVDGVTRSDPLVVDYYGTHIPSVAVQSVTKFLNLRNEDIQLRVGESLKLGGLNIKLDSTSRMKTFFYKSDYDEIPFSVESFIDVVTERIPPRRFKDKIVLVGAVAAGIGATQVTPVNPKMPPVITLAHTISSILSEDFLVTPEWAKWASIALFFLITLYLIIWVPIAGAAVGAFTSITLLITLIGFQLAMLEAASFWVPLMSPVVLLVIGHILISTLGFLVSEKGKRDSDMDSAESNRMLALSFQGQGQLDIAFEKFMKCPLDERLMDLLYNLGLDFERKRQFSKAGAVYHYMMKFDSGYKDIDMRQKRSTAMDQSVILSPQQSSNTLVLEDNAIEKPMLGRYEVIKELGKGAMGIVYLGQDPKISRTVAIKTMALAQEFDEEELGSVKVRFFREAETAGRLNHPNIVTIYDAGEELDLAYIAMEFLEGCELTKYTKPDTLLPIKHVLMLMADAAGALAYADDNNVVHRDVKPANVIYNPETKKIKITDFGIARITDASKTKTGTVLGTPSYMSPEQFSGQKADGRADLFSLGVMMFQLLTGKLPFEGDSMAGLMFAITSNPHPDPVAIRPELPECVSGILDIALSKKAEDRYQNGYEMAAELTACADALNDQE
ncbi:MAG: CHASE2 domain-containing protein [Gammaproteobacteria bacterium]|nr:CHASE2 domain-containing protein [Gammaproteobacteria bacterium]